MMLKKMEEGNRNKQYEDILEDPKHLLSLGALILIIASSLKWIIYYKYFGVDITSFMDFTELTFSFLGELYSIVFIFAFYLLLFSSGDKKNKAVISTINNNRYILRLSIFYIILLIIAYILSIWFYTYYVFYTILLLGLAALSTSFAFLKDLRLKFILCFPTFFFYIIAQTTVDAYEIIEQGKQKVVEIKIQDKVIETNESFLYIGKTNNYTFFITARKMRL